MCIRDRAIGGQVANNSLGRVLAMSDFDVLTEPFVDRFENRNMLDFVANFLTGAQRTPVGVVVFSFLMAIITFGGDTLQITWRRRGP